MPENWREGRRGRSVLSALGTMFWHGLLALGSSSSNSAQHLHSLESHHFHDPFKLAPKLMLHLPAPSHATSVDAIVIGTVKAYIGMHVIF